MSSFFQDLDFFYINMNKSKDRDAYIKNHCLENKIENFKRVEAIDGKNNGSPIRGLSFSESGCTLSHIKAVSDFYYNSSNEYAVICEDDVDISNVKKITFSFYDTLNIYNPEFYCLQLASLTREDMNIDFSLRPRTFWDFSTAAYIINKKYAKLLLENYSTTDEIYKNFISNKHIDPRGGIIDTRPVADELVYSLTETHVFPIFSFRPVESSINCNDEQYRQVLHSIKLFENKWSNYEQITIESFSP